MEVVNPSMMVSRLDLVVLDYTAAGIRFLAPVLIIRGYIGIYRRKEYVGGAPRGP